MDVLSFSHIIGMPVAGKCACQIYALLVMLTKHNRGRAACDCCVVASLLNLKLNHSREESDEWAPLWFEDR